MKIIYFGHNQRGLKCFQALVEKRIPVLALVVQEKPQTGTIAKQMVALAKKHKIPWICQLDPNKGDFVSWMRFLKPDCLVLAGFTGILRKEALSVALKCSINLHGGRLPAYRGASVLNWQILDGNKKVGISVIEVSSGLDTGPILCQRSFSLSPEEDFNYVAAKSLELFPKMLIETLKKIEQGTIKKKPQKLLEGAYYFKRYPDDGRINWETMNAKTIFNLIRAVAPPAGPGAFTYRNKEKIIVAKASLIEDARFRGMPGRVGMAITLAGRTGRVVCAQDKALLIEKIFRSGKSVDVKTYLKPGEMFL